MADLPKIGSKGLLLAAQEGHDRISSVAHIKKETIPINPQSLPERLRDASNEGTAFNANQQLCADAASALDEAMKALEVYAKLEWQGERARSVLTKLKATYKDQR